MTLIEEVARLLYRGPDHEPPPMMRAMARDLVALVVKRCAKVGLDYGDAWQAEQSKPAADFWECNHKAKAARRVAWRIQALLQEPPSE